MGFIGTWVHLLDLKYMQAFMWVITTLKQLEVYKMMGVMFVQAVVILTKGFLVNMFSLHQNFSIQRIEQVMEKLVKLCQSNGEEIDHKIWIDSS
jgi:hypothetical protein